MSLPTCTDDGIRVHPVQTHQYHRGQAWCPEVVTRRAYEVYCHLYGEQPALVEDGCRGGFGAGELIALLYARSFPKEEWRKRASEAFRGAKNL